MNPRHLAAAVFASLLGSLAPRAAAQYLMVTNFSSLGRSVMLFNKSDGSLVQKNWIVSDATNVLNSPTEALAIGTVVWISDQVQNKVFRYDLATAAYLPAVTGSDTTSLSNIRGIETAGNTVYVTNTGTGFNNSVVMFDATTGAYQGFFTLPPDLPPWDVKLNNNQLLLSNYTSSFVTGISRVDRYDLAGNFLANLYLNNNSSGTGLTGPQQINVEANGNFLVGGFSGTTQTGVYEFDGSWAQVGWYAPGLGTRAGFRLDNGNVMFTKGDGVWSWNPNTNTALPLLAGSNINAKYINEIAFITPPTPPLSAGVSQSAVCSGSSATLTLTAAGGSGNALKWYSGLCGGTPVGTGTPLNISPPPATTTYYARWESGPVYTSCAAVTVSVFASGGGDANADGFVNGDDIPGFVNALLLPGVPGPAYCPCDMNADGQVTPADIPLFLSAELGI